MQESQTSIQKAEKSISILVMQQAQTKRKLSQLYNELLSLTSDSGDINDRQRVRTADLSCNMFWNIHMYNSLSYASGEELLRHCFQYSALINTVSDRFHTFPSQVTPSAQAQGIDPLVPLCPYALGGSCTDEVGLLMSGDVCLWYALQNCKLQHLVEVPLPLPATASTTSTTHDTTACTSFVTTTGTVPYHNRRAEPPAGEVDPPRPPPEDTAWRLWKYVAFRKFLQTRREAYCDARTEGGRGGGGGGGVWVRGRVPRYFREDASTSESDSGGGGVGGGQSRPSGDEGLILGHTHGHGNGHGQTPSDGEGTPEAVGGGDVYEVLNEEGGEGGEGCSAECWGSGGGDWLGHYVWHVKDLLRARQDVLAEHQQEGDGGWDSWRDVQAVERILQPAGSPTEVLVAVLVWRLFLVLSLLHLTS